MLAWFILGINWDHSYKIASPVSLQVQFVYLNMAEWSLAPQSKSKRSVLAPKMVPFGWVKYSTILGANVAHLEWSRFDPNKQGRNSTLLKGQNEEAKGMFWKNRG